MHFTRAGPTSSVNPDRLVGDAVDLEWWLLAEDHDVRLILTVILKEALVLVEYEDEGVGLLSLAIGICTLAHGDGQGIGRLVQALLLVILELDHPRSHTLAIQVGSQRRQIRANSAVVLHLREHALGIDVVVRVHVPAVVPEGKEVLLHVHVLALGTMQLRPNAELGLLVIFVAPVDEQSEVLHPLRQTGCLDAVATVDDIGVFGPVEDARVVWSDEVVEVVDFAAFAPVACCCGDGEDGGRLDALHYSVLELSIAH